LNLNTLVMGLGIPHHQVFTMTQSTPLHLLTIAKNIIDQEHSFLRSLFYRLVACIFVV
jgi:hypothetical protein